MKGKNKQVHSMRTDMPLFTVAILTFQQRHLLEDCLCSVFEQTYPNIELVVCDDCSADFQIEDVKAFIEENKGKNIRRVVVYKHSQNVGTVLNAQQAIELSTGEYFKLHAGDDMLFDETALETVGAVLEQEEISIVAARSVACQQDGTITDQLYPSEDAFSHIAEADATEQFTLMATQAWGEYINAPAVFWKRSFFDRMGGFDLSYRYTEDWPMWLKITDAGYKITMLDEVTTIYRYGGISNDSSTLNQILGKAHYQECIRMMREVALPKFEAQGNTMKSFRCKQCIRCLETRISSEGQWAFWDCIEQTIWRIKHIPVLLISWAYRKKKYGIAINRKIPLIVMCMFALLYRFQVRIDPNHPEDTLWATGFAVAFIWLICKEIYVLMIKLLNGMINHIKGGEQRE